MSLVSRDRPIMSKQHQVVVAAQERETQSIAIHAFSASCDDAFEILLETLPVQYTVWPTAKLKGQEFGQVTDGCVNRSVWDLVASTLMLPVRRFPIQIAVLDHVAARYFGPDSVVGFECGIGHSERFEYSRLNVVGIWLAGSPAQRRAKNRVSNIGIAELGARLESIFGFVKGCNQNLFPVGDRALQVLVGVVGFPRQSRRMSGKLNESYRRRGGVTALNLVDFRKILFHGVGKMDLAVLD